MVAAGGRCSSFQAVTKCPRSKAPAFGLITEAQSAARQADTVRLAEELGATTRLHFGFRTHYRAKFANGLAENEIVYVYFGTLPARLRLNPLEVAAVSLQTLAELKHAAARQPENYVFWLNHYLTQHDREIRAGLKRVS